MKIKYSKILITRNLLGRWGIGEQHIGISQIHWGVWFQTMAVTQVCNWLAGGRSGLQFVKNSVSVLCSKVKRSETRYTCTLISGITQFFSQWWKAHLFLTEHQMKYLSHTTGHHEWKKILSNIKIVFNMVIWANHLREQEIQVSHLPSPSHSLPNCIQDNGKQTHLLLKLSLILSPSLCAPIAFPFNCHFI